jgi:hypothetical protein
LLHFSNSLSERKRYVERSKGGCMFEVYLNEKHDRLLVIERGHPVPVIENSGRWRKKKGAVAVSDEIRLALQRDGFYWRRLAEHRKTNPPPRKPASPVAASNRPSSRNDIENFQGAAE